MKKAMKMRAAWLSVAGLTLLAACGGNDNNEAANENAGAENNNDNDNVEVNDGGNNEEVDEDLAEANEMLDDGTLVIAMGTDMVSWDVHDHGNTSTEAVHVNVFDYMFKRAEGTMEIEPHLVEDYETIEEDVWEFTLRDDVYWHNGDQLTAEDVKFTFDRVLGDDSLSEHARFTQLGEIEVLDEFTLRFNTDGPQPTILNRLAQTGAGIIPKDYIEENGIDEFLENPIGTGPYEFVEWERDDRVVLSKYDDYFLGDDYTEWDEVVFRAIPESSTRVGELLTGGAHVVTDIPPNEWPRVDDEPGTSHVSAESNRTMLIIARQTEGSPGSDPRVLEAIEYAIDNEAITEQVMSGSAVPTRTRVLPGNVGANEELFDTYLYDPDHARDLLAEAGYEDGLELTMQSPQGRYLMDSDIAEVIAGMVGEVGIDLNVEFLEWSQFIEHYQNNTNDDLMLLGLATSLYDAAQALDHYYSDSPLNEGRMDWVNEDFDELFFAAETNMDPDERLEQYLEAQELVAEGRPHIYLHSINMNFGVNDELDYTPRHDEIYYVNEIRRR